MHTTRQETRPSGGFAEAPRHTKPETTDAIALVSATIQSIEYATANVQGLICRVRQVADSLLGEVPTATNGLAMSAAPELSGRAYVANYRLGYLQSQIEELSAEVARLETL